MIPSDSATPKNQNEPGDTTAGMRKVHIGWRSAHLSDPSTACMACHGGPGKFARTLLHNASAEEYLMGHSLFGINTTNGQKDALVLIRVNAVLGFTCRKFPGTNMPNKKNTLASPLAWDLKSPEEPKLDS